MAAEKKATTKATAVKKVTGKKSGGASELIIDVPQGGQVISTFELSPKRPKAGKSLTWKLVDTATRKKVSDLVVGFSVKSSPIEREFERAVLVVNLADDGDSKKGIWRFALNGVEAGDGTSDVLNDVATEITNQGKTLIAYIHALDLGKETINYGYVASFTDAASGEVTLYESRDPGISIGRPRGP